MSAGVALVRRSFGRVARPLLALAVVLAAFQFALVGVATSVAADRGIAGLTRFVPTFLQQSLGVALLSFAGLSTLGFFDALIVMLVVQFAIYLASEPAADVESGVVDLLLARSLPRRLLITRTLVVTIVSVTVLIAVMSVALWLGLLTLVPRDEVWPSVSVVATMAAHLAFVAWCFGAAALAASGWARRRGSAIFVIAVAAIALYLIDFLATMWRPLEPLARLSPFHYFRGGEILAGTANAASNLTVLGMFTAAGVALAYFRFGKRDL